MDYLEGLTLTKPKSFATVILTKNPSGFLVEFPKNSRMFARIVNIPGVLYGDDSPYETRSFYIPRHQLEALKAALEDKADWRDPNELQKDLDFQSQPQETLQDVLSRISPDIDTSFMKIEPYSFQKLAIAWANTSKGLQKIKGGILADTMGLGKTLEGMAIACYLKKMGVIGRTLIITPSPIKEQFAKEITRFTHEQSIVIKSRYKGFQDRKNLYDNIRALNPFFTIINYELLHQKEVIDTIVVKTDKKTGKQTKKKVFGDYLDLREILDIGYDMVIVDEAHKMKNPTTEIAKAIRQIDAKFKLLMTGTPIQKELKNIFQLFDYIDPSILSDPTLPFEKRKEFFETQFLMKRINPFVPHLPKDLDNINDDLLQIFGEKNELALRKRFNPFLLRRLTEDVSDEMPDEVIQEIEVEFNDEQLEVLEKLQETIEQYKENIEKEKDPEKRKSMEDMMKGLLQTRMVICDSPTLLLESNSPMIQRLVGKKKKFKRVEKIEVLLQKVEEILDSGDKVVIFSKFARMATLLAEEITKMVEKKCKEEKIEPYKCFVYKGDTKSNERERIVELFQNDPNTRILCCTDAANFGINLQISRFLINMDYPEEFSTYLQRNGRIRRLGSLHDKVFILNFLTRTGKDEQVYKALQRQIKLNEKIIENKQLDNEAIKKANEEIQKVILQVS